MTRLGYCECGAPIMFGGPTVHKPGCTHNLKAGPTMTTDNQEWRVIKMRIKGEVRFMLVNDSVMTSPSDLAPNHWPTQDNADSWCNYLNAQLRQSRRWKAALERIRDDPDYTSAIQRAEEALEGDVDG